MAVGNLLYCINFFKFNRAATILDIMDFGLYFMFFKLSREMNNRYLKLTLT